MARLDEFVFGYRRGSVEKKHVAKAANLLLKNEICSVITPEGAFRIREKDRKRFLALAKPKFRFDLGEPLGVYGFLHRSRRRYGIFAAVITLLCICLFTSGLVWDVRISGNERLSDYVIEDALIANGFEVGTPWRKVDKNALEAEILTERPDIAWISINRRGTVAYVEVIESENVGIIEQASPKYSNIVAERDGVIEEITVKSGVAAVKVGDVVRKGDILISGVVENESGVSFCRAEGSVRAQSVLNVTSEASRKVNEKQPLKRKLAYARVVIFNFSINIFKNYGNRENSCDIIEEIREFALFDKYRLPIRLETAHSIEYGESSRIRSEDEMILVARRELDGKIYSMFKDADVISLSTSGEFGDGIYYLTSRVVYSTDIGKESAIEIN
ncbi:MAG: sporulation protein YqfD [Clostridia bacterium]|nr:sporulation protein YqfD [Clostridia bacterium]